MLFRSVVNPAGKAMASTVIGGSSTVQICPSPIIRWDLKHSAAIHISAMTRSGSTVTVTCAARHYLNSADSVDIVNSNNIPDGTYASIVATSANTFTFALAGSAFTEGDVGATTIKSGLVPTRYRLEKLASNGMVRLVHQDG